MPPRTSEALHVESVRLSPGTPGTDVERCPILRTAQPHPKAVTRRQKLTPDTKASSSSLKIPGVRLDCTVRRNEAGIRVVFKRNIPFEHARFFCKLLNFKKVILSECEICVS